MNDQAHKTILILSASYGAGHTSAAKALVAHLEAAQHTATYRDLLSFVPNWQARLLRAPYTLIIRHFPRIYGLVFWLIRFPLLLSLFKLSYMPLIAAKKKAIAAYIANINPDYIICTHFTWGEILDNISRPQDLPPYYTCVTDYNYHPIWRSNHTAGYLVGSSEVQEAFIQAGIHRDIISITGIPVDPKFDKPTHIKKNQITVLLGGQTFVIPTKKIQQTATKHPDTNVVVICGKSKPIQQYLTKKLTRYPNITVLGWVDNVYDYLHQSQYIITKTGGLTTTECIVAGVPIDPTKPIPGQETANYNLLNKRGLLYGQTQKNTDGLPVFTVDRLLFLKDCAPK